MTHRVAHRRPPARGRVVFQQAERRTPGFLLWGAAAIFVCFAHVAFAWVTFLSPQRPQKMGEQAAAIMVELAPAPSPRLPDTGVAMSPAGQVSAALDTTPAPDASPATPPVPAAVPNRITGAVPLPTRPPDTRPSRGTTARQAETKPAPDARQEAAAPSSAPASSPLPQMADASATASDLPSDWKSRLLAHLNKYKRYPAGARTEGVTVISFAMDRDGQLLGYAVARSSGDPALDAEASAMLQRAVPLPPFPPETLANSLQLTVPVRFTVR
ncbi:protein TonB [Azorhizobium oxalatiphilum]|uniref:Protein TonB n=1 Tax=Azorhizobium oxalatiphilum TaxID=980631 RepID=A0A917F6H0_9HYPH|nr:TonB family protein [Azorhizobium oxalatiphilum]GGF55707.1 protein TonB [Azorhizobium oxalatiphilum]